MFRPLVSALLSTAFVCTAVAQEAASTPTTSAAKSVQSSGRSRQPESIELTEMAQRVSQTTGKKIILDPSVRGKVYVATTKPLSTEEYWDAFQISLYVNGFSYVEKNGFVVVMPGRSIQRDQVPIVEDLSTIKEERMITWIRPLKNVSALDVNKYLRTLTTKDGVMETFEPSNLVILTDYTSNVKRVSALLDKTDVKK